MTVVENALHVANGAVVMFTHRRSWRSLDARGLRDWNIDTVANPRGLLSLSIRTLSGPAHRSPVRHRT